MTIEERMEFLERTIRRWRRIACTMAVLVVAAIGIGAAQMNEDELMLRKLVIQDEEGHDRIELDTFGGTARIRHYDTNGKPRIDSGTSMDGNASITHYDTNGKPRIDIGTLPDGNASIAHFDANGKTRIINITSSDGQAGISHSDSNEKMRIITVTYPDGKASITHYDTNEKTRIASVTDPNGDAFTAWQNYDTDGNRKIVKSLP